MVNALWLLGMIPAFLAGWALGLGDCFHIYMRARLDAMQEFLVDPNPEQDEGHAATRYEVTDSLMRDIKRRMK